MMKMKVSALMVLLFVATAYVSAQGMMGGGVGPGMMGGAQVTAEEIAHTKQEEAEGLEVWEKLESKELSCADLTDEDFDVLGEYFMGQSAGENHAAMNKRITEMMGEDGETQMHISMGKSYSGCYNGTGYYGMGPGMMGTGFTNQNQQTYGMMGPGMMGSQYGYGMMGGYGLFSIWNLLWLGTWALVIIALILGIIYLLKKIKEKPADKKKD